MKAAVLWTIGGDFQVVDADDDNAPLAELKLYEPLRSMAIDEPETVVNEILRALVETPHPFSKQNAVEPEVAP